MIDVASEGDQKDIKINVFFVCMYICTDAWACFQAFTVCMELSDYKKAV